MELRRAGTLLWRSPDGLAYVQGTRARQRPGWRCRYARTGPAKVDEFAAAFTASPDVSAHHRAGVGYNIDHHLAGRQYRGDVLDWAVELGAR
jgi:hypothetical protein